MEEGRSVCQMERAQVFSLDAMHWCIAIAMAPPSPSSRHPYSALHQRADIDENRNNIYEKRSNSDKFRNLN